MSDDSAATGPRLGIADDHPIMRAALRSALQALGPDTRFVEASDTQTTLALVEKFPDLDLLLLDLNMPGTQGLETVRSIRARAPQLPVAVISAEQQPGIADRLLNLGVAGFIPKSDPPDVIVSAVRLVLAGGVYMPPHLLNSRSAASDATTPAAGDAANLTARQRDVLQLLAEGKPNKVIARELGVTEGTVKVHLLAVFRALNVRNRTAAVLAAQRLLG